MRILHTSDWHLGRTLEGRSRIQEQKELINELCLLLEQENVHLVLVAGDIFDTYNPSAEAEGLFFEALERLSGNGQRGVVVIAGNHDSPDRLHAANPLAYKQGIFLIGYPGENLFAKSGGSAGISEAAASLDAGAKSGELVKLAAGGSGWLEIAVPGCSEHAIIAFLPYPSEQRLNEVLAQSLEEGELQKAYSERVALAFQQGAVNFRDDTVNLAISHIYVLGGRSSESEREIQLGGAYVVEPAALPEKAHYVALGHLHRPQAVSGTPIPCRYAGSPLCYSFSEADQQKEVVLIEVIPKQKTEIRPIKLVIGNPLRFLRFFSYQEACQWCAAEKNQNIWVDMEIQSPEPLLSSQVTELRKLHPGIINIRVVLPGTDNDEKGGQRLTDLPLPEKFSRFAVRETGVSPQQELIDLLLELLEGGEEIETDQA